MSETGYETPTDIQQQAIPVVLSGRDMMACAQTGTGKSAAFCLPLLQQVHLLKEQDGHAGIRSLILAPTRELAVQISESLTTYGQHTGLNHTAIFGGIPRKVQMDYLSRDIDILVATPGRLLDLMDREIVSLAQVSHFVLDEADTMLNLGFLKEVEQVINRLPEHRQTLLFSATLPYEIKMLAKSLLKDPVSLQISPQKPAALPITQELFYVEGEHKQSLLLHLLKMNPVDSAFIFVKTRQGAQQLADRLTEAGYKAEVIHSDRSQKERQEALDRFREKSVNLLVATDVVARGIDVEKVSHVFNMELPQEADNYIHRIGRTGRAGHTGIAITLCEPSETEKINKIEKLLKQRIPINETHPFMSLALRRKVFAAATNPPKKAPEIGRAHG